jgi:hypothetical protein
LISALQAWLDSVAPASFTGRRSNLVQSGLVLLLPAISSPMPVQLGFSQIDLSQIYPFTTLVEVLMHTTVSILAEIPEELHESLKGYLENHPDWDQDRVFSAALSLFLLQNGTGDTPETSRSYRRAARVYLDTLFKHAV